MKKLLLICCILMTVAAQAQNEGATRVGGGASPGGSGSFNPSRSNFSGGGKDTIGFVHRDDSKDSVGYSFRYLDSLRYQRPDTNINDFSRYYILSWKMQYLGNSGAAAYPLIFTPLLKTGIDPGFHAFDAYKFTLEGTRFYRTNKPFTQIGYQLASGKEQLINILHFQSPRPNLHFGFEYRLLNAPGFFVNQNANHNSYRLFSNYQGRRKRYAAAFVMMGNTIKNSENGGMVRNDYLDTPIYQRRFAIPVNLAFQSAYLPNPFNSFVSTGNQQKEFTLFFRHHYDIGKKDSIAINDSTTEYLFYPRLRFQHTLSWATSGNTYIDSVTGGRVIDSAIYKNWYDTIVRRSVRKFTLADEWQTLSNDFSILQFPDAKNQGQYILAGARIETTRGRFNSGERSFYNSILHGEYRNKTRNKLWDIHVQGEFYLAGFNSGDYRINAGLSRYLNRRWGNVSLQFSNVNRTPSFVFNASSSFNFNGFRSLSKENITVVRATADNPFIRLDAANYLLTNYTYFSGYYQTAQFGSVINLLQLSGSKTIHLTRRWNLYSELTAQVMSAGSPIRVPLFFTRNRLAYEGLFFRNLNLSTGLEIRYHSPFKGYDYSPVTGQFFPQDSITLNNRPDVHAFLHFRIRSFSGYIRAENLNSMDFSNGFGFTKSNFAAPHYVYPGFLFRFGILWNFAN